RGGRAVGGRESVHGDAPGTGTGQGGMPEGVEDAVAPTTVRTRGPTVVGWDGLVGQSWEKCRDTANDGGSLDGARDAGPHGARQRVGEAHSLPNPGARGRVRLRGQGTNDDDGHGTALRLAPVATRAALHLRDQRDPRRPGGRADGALRGRKH